jgi:hypothetical protein
LSQKYGILACSRHFQKIGHENGGRKEGRGKPIKNYSIFSPNFYGLKQYKTVYEDWVKDWRKIWMGKDEINLFKMRSMSKNNKKYNIGNLYYICVIK